MFPSTESPIRKRSRFGGDSPDNKPRLPPGTKYSVLLRPSAELQANRGSLSDHDFYLVPTSQDLSSTPTARGSMNSLSLSYPNYGNLTSSSNTTHSQQGNISASLISSAHVGGGGSLEHNREPHNFRTDTPDHGRCSKNQSNNNNVIGNDAPRIRLHRRG